MGAGRKAMSGHEGGRERGERIGKAQGMRDVLAHTADALDCWAAIGTSTGKQRRWDRPWARAGQQGIRQWRSGWMEGNMQ
eukprot:891761-Alexandrium_andersonii.AAC.1